MESSRGPRLRSSLYAGNTMARALRRDGFSNARGVIRLSATGGVRPTSLGAGGGSEARRFGGPSSQERLEAVQQAAGKGDDGSLGQAEREELFHVEFLALEVRGAEVEHLADDAAYIAQSLAKTARAEHQDQGQDAAQDAGEDEDGDPVSPAHQSADGGQHFHVARSASVQQVEGKVEEQGEGYRESSVAQAVPERRLQESVEGEADQHAGQREPVRNTTIAYVVIAGDENDNGQQNLHGPRKSSKHGLSPQVYYAPRGPGVSRSRSRPVCSSMPHPT